MIATTGVPSKDGAVEPSIRTGCVMSGRDSVRLTLPATVKAISSAPAFAFAWSIASRKEPTPLLLRLLTEMLPALLETQVIQWKPH